MEEPYRSILLVIFILIYPLVYIYLQQRARNQADLDVKKKLTSIEEAIKTANALQIDRGKQIFSEEKDSIIVFFAQLNTWIWESLNINISNFNTSNIETIKERLIKMQDASNKTKVAFAKVMLIINDVEMVRLGQEAINKTSQVHSFRGENLINLRNCLEEQMKIQNRMNSMNPGTSEDPNPDFIAYYEAYDELEEGLNLQGKIVNAFKTNNLNIFSTAMEAVNSFRDSAQTYIRKESSNN